jgi:hypothetical protein
MLDGIGWRLHGKETLSRFIWVVDVLTLTGWAYEQSGSVGRCAAVTPRLSRVHASYTSAK